VKKIPSVLSVEALYARGIRGLEFTKKPAGKRSGLLSIGSNVAMRIADDFTMNCRIA